VWESSQDELLSHVLDNKRLLRKSEDTVDKWLWRNVESTDFFVKVAYNILLMRSLQGMETYSRSSRI